MSDLNNIYDKTNQNLTDEELVHFNWGAFLWTWIWCLGNNDHSQAIKFILVLLAIWFVSFIFGFIPFLGTVIFIFGIILWFNYTIKYAVEANSTAWEKKHWNSIEHFRNVQRNWVKAWLVFAVVITILITILIPISETILESKLTQINDILRCELVGTLVQKTLKNVPQDSSTYYDDLEKAIKEAMPGSDVKHDGSTFKYYYYGRNPGVIRSVEFDVTKSGECSFSKANCYVETPVEANDGVCRLFYKCFSFF